MKKKLLITGAFGLVGTAICKLLEEKYPDIEVVKFKSDMMTDNTLPIMDYVIFAAGYGQPGKFLQERISTININTIGLQRTLKHLKPQGKVLFVSSSEVYSGAPSPYKEDSIGTTTPQHPRACYIEGKRCGEAICMAYSDQYDVKIARLALAYGPGTKKGDTRVLNQFIEQALTTGAIIMKDSGKAMRTYCYVDDVATQLLNILFHGQSIVYNVGGFSRVSVKDLAHIIGTLTNSAVMEGPDTTTSAPDDVQLDMTKYLSEFGGTFTPMNEGIRKTIDYQKNLYKN